MNLQIKNKQLSEVINKMFEALLVLYLILVIAEQIKEDSVSNYFDNNYLLIAVVVFGIISAFTKQRPIKKEPATWKDYLFTATLSILGFGIILYKTLELGWISYAISTIVGILILLLSYLVLNEDE